MRYIIIDTWNGEGYSDSGIIEDVTYTDMTEDNARYNALELARGQFARRYLPSLEGEEVKVTFYEGVTTNAIHAEIGKDQGAVHFVRVKGDYGLLIKPDINDVKLLTHEQFLGITEDLSKDSELLSNLEDEENTFTGWLDELYTEGNNDGYCNDGYLILYKL